jgi:RNA polymerase sigma-70 factor (ECF subfamily)
VKEDRFWIERVKNGKKNDFAHIIKKYKDPIYYFILKMVRNEEDAMDLAQETFIKAFNGLEGYREDFSFKSWLFTIASHHTIDFLRKKKQRKEIDLLEIDRDRPYVTMVDALIKNERMQRLDREIEQLPDNYRMVILLKHKEELTIEEIAGIMDIPEGTVKVWLHRARNQLKKRMSSDEKRSI